MPWAQHLRGHSLSGANPAFGMSPRVSPSLIVYLGHLACLTLGQAQLFSLSPIYSLCLSDSLLKLSVCFCLAHDLWSLLISTDQQPALPASLGTWLNLVVPQPSSPVSNLQEVDTAQLAASHSRPVQSAVARVPKSVPST